LPAAHARAPAAPNKQRPAVAGQFSGAQRAGECKHDSSAGGASLLGVKADAAQQQEEGSGSVQSRRQMQ
jgi:hypothetical protein